MKTTYASLLLLCLMLTASLAQAQTRSVQVAFPIVQLDSMFLQRHKAKILLRQSEWALDPKGSAYCMALYDEANPIRKKNIGTAILIAQEAEAASFEIASNKGVPPRVGDCLYVTVNIDADVPETEGLALVQHAVTLHDAQGKPLYAPADWLSRSAPKKLEALLKAMVKQAQQQAASMPFEAKKGHFKGMTAPQAAAQLTATDARSCLRHGLTAHWELSGQRLNAGELLLRWAAQGAPCTYDDLLSIYREAPQASWPELDKRYADYVSSFTLRSWLSLRNTDELRVALHHSQRLGDKAKSAQLLQSMVKYAATDKERQEYEAQLQAMQAPKPKEENVPATSPDTRIAYLQQQGGGLERKKDYAGARKYYAEAESMAAENGKASKAARIAADIGLTYVYENNYRAATGHFDRALGLAKQGKDNALIATVHFYLAAMHMSNTNRPAAQTHLSQGLHLTKVYDLSYEKVLLQRVKASYLSEGGEYDAAMQVLQEGIALCLEKEYTGMLGNMLRDLGFYKAQLGDLEQGILLYDSALHLAERANDQTQIVANHVMTADLHIYLGNYKKAEELLGGALDWYKRQEDLWGVAAVHLSLGNLDNSLGTYAEALEHYRLADSLYQAIGSPYSRTTPINSTGTVYYWQGDYPKSLSYFEQALHIIDSLGIKSSFNVLLLVNKAEVLVELDRFDEADALLEQALAIALEMGDHAGEMSAANAMGNADLRRKRYAEAKAHYETAARLNESIQSKIGGLNASTQLGRVSLMLQDTAAAAKHLDASIAAHEAAGSEKYLWEALYMKGLIAKGKGKNAEARDYLMKAVEVLERIQNRVVGGDEAKKLFNAGVEKIKVYDALVGVLIAQGETQLALQYVERSNNQEMRNLIRTATEGYHDPAKEEAIRLERSLQAGIDQYDAQIAKEKAKSNTSAERILQLQSARHIAEQEYQEYVHNLSDEYPEFSRMKVDPSNFKAKMRSMRPDMASISYLPGEERLYIFLLTADSVVAKEVKIERRRLVEAINFLHGSATFRLGEKDFAPLEDLTGGKAPSRGNATPDSDFKKYSELLYNALIAPLRTQLQGKRYVGIAPSGMLHLLPFQLLGHTNPDGRFVMAIEEHAIFYHYNEVDDRMSISTDSIRILALGNADGSLPATEKEVGHISTHFPETHSKTGAHATEALVKQQIKSYNVLHFATHGYIDMANKLNSYLLLSPSEEHEEDGRLTVQEVMRLSLSGYYLVTLSACETAVSDPKKEWPVSPVSEFLIAGANSVVGSLWKVDDAATGMLMATFYRHLSEGIDKVDALRMAQLELSQHAEYSHPYYWAPFILVGNW